MFSSLPPHAPSHSPISYNLAPLDHISPQDLSLSLGCAPASQFDVTSTSATRDMTSWGNHSPIEFSNSQPSSVYSGSPARSDLGLPLVAPRPQHVPGPAAFDMWQDISQHVGPESKLEHVGLSGGLLPQHMSGPGVADMDAQQMNMTEFETLFAGVDGFAF
jgi:hypothetical protein